MHWTSLKMWRNYFSDPTVNVASIELKVHKVTGEETVRLIDGEVCQNMGPVVRKNLIY